MDILAENKSIMMLHKDIAKTPAYRLEDDYSIRFFRPGDDQAWIDIHKLADRWNEVGETQFENAFGDYPLSLEERQLYLLNSRDETIGTATAWQREMDGKMYGLLHWVAIHPDYQGKGLAKPLLSATCSLFRKLGYREVFLNSSTARLPAINLYRKFGFEPLIRNAADEEIWQLLQPHLR